MSREEKWVSRHEYSASAARQMVCEDCISSHRKRERESDNSFLPQPQPRASNARKSRPKPREINRYFTGRKGGF